MSVNEVGGDGMNGSAVERIAGIHEDLPLGERVLWQGAPSWFSLARHAFHIREVAAYFVLLAASSAVMNLIDGVPVTGAAAPLGVGAIGCLLLAFLAWLSSRTTTYAVTTRRVFLRVGIALPLTINLPLRRIEGAALALHRDGCGDLPLSLEKGPHLAFLHLWPHARPWHLKHPEPMMRCIAQPEHVARILADALQVSHAEQAARAAQDVADGTTTTEETAGAAVSTAPVPSHSMGIGARHLHGSLSTGQQHGYGAAA